MGRFQAVWWVISWDSERGARKTLRQSTLGWLDIWNGTHSIHAASTGTGTWTWARCIQAHAFVQTRVDSARASSSARPGRDLETARARWWSSGDRLLRGWRRWLSKHGDCDGPHKHAISHFAIEVALSLNASVVFAGSIVELDADPVSLGEVWLADIADVAGAAVAQLDFLSYG